MPGLGLGLRFTAASRWNGWMRVAVAVSGVRRPGRTRCGLRAAIAGSGRRGGYCPNQPCRSLEPPRVGEEHGDEFRLGRREADAYAAEALAPPELFTHLRRCADSHFDVCVGKHDVEGRGVRHGSEDLPGDAERREAVMILLDRLR